MNYYCQSCNNQIPIVSCNQCGIDVCYRCDEQLHPQDQHIRITITFQPLKQFTDDLTDTIENKKQQLNELKIKEQQITKQFQEKMVQAKQKYETQIIALETRLQKAQHQMNDLNQQDDQLDVDNLQNELEALEKNLKLDIKQAEEEQKILLEKTQKVDHLLDRVKKATDIEQQQIAKMNEVLLIFKSCSEQLQKEKEILMLDNEKLIGEVEIFSKFFEENGPLLEELSKKQQ